MKGYGNPIVVGIDWLQLYCFKSPHFMLSLPANFLLKKLDYGTRIFEDVHELTVDGQRIATLVSKPFSRVINPDACLIKFDNYILYEKNLSLKIQKVLEVVGLEFRSISRLDIYADYVQFKNNLNSESLIRKFTSQKYLKEGKADFQVRGKTNRTISCSYLRFGSKNSNIGYYIYNKSLELREVATKPWIVNSWRINGYTGEQDVWRCEFSINSTQKSFIDPDTGVIEGLKTLDTIYPENFVNIFSALFQKYMSFRINDGQIRLDRMKPISLLNLPKTTYLLANLVSNKIGDRSAKIFIKQLKGMNDELRRSKWDEVNASDQLLIDYIGKRELVKWSQDKGYYPKIYQDKFVVQKEGEQ